MNTSFGDTLRTAREAKGLTTSQVAAQTRMLVQIVEDMEREDFHRIAAPIYGRGFVKLYAECVGLDPLPLVREFMDIYEGRRAPIVRTRDVPAATDAPEAAEDAINCVPPANSGEGRNLLRPEDSGEAEDAINCVPPANSGEGRNLLRPTDDPGIATEPAAEPPPVVRGLDLFERSPEPPPAEGGSRLSRPENPDDAGTTDNSGTIQDAAPAAPAARRNHADIFADSPYLTSSSYAERGPSAAERFRKGLSSVSHGVVGTVQRIPRSAWRITLLAVAAVLVLGLGALGVVKLYHMTSPAQPGTPGPAGAANAPLPEAAPVAPAQPPAADKTPAAGKTPTPAKPAADKTPAAPQPATGPLRSTGPRVPPLYVD